LLSQSGLILDVDQKRSLQAIPARQQPVVDVELALYRHRVGQACHAQQLLHAKPQSLTVFEEQCQERANADTTIPVEIALVRFQKLAPLAGVFVQRQEVIQCEGAHESSLQRQRYVPYFLRFSVEVTGATISTDSPPSVLPDRMRYSYTPPPA